VGTYNFTSTESSQYPAQSQVENVRGDGENIGDGGETSRHAQNLGEREHNDEDVEVVLVQENIDLEPNQTEPRVASAPSRSEQEKEPKRRRSANGDVAAMMEKYIEMRAKQVEDEKEKAKAVDEFSIKKCINLLNTMDITPNEEIKAFRVFKIPENREIFLSANPEIALMWLRSEME